jgi:hypothetical protein
MGMSLGNSKSSSEIYCACLPLTLLLLHKGKSIHELNIETEKPGKFHLPLRIYFFLRAVRVHVVKLVLLMPDADSVSAEVHVVRVPNSGADSHLVRKGLNSSCGVGCFQCP